MGFRTACENRRMMGSVPKVLRGWRLVAVFVLAIAVVGMHSMGTGHHGAGEAGSHATHHQVAGQTAVTAHPASLAGPGSHHASAGPEGISDLTGLTSVAVAACHGCMALGGDAMGAMCLAVVSGLLALALLLALRHRLRARTSLTLPSWSRPTVTSAPLLRRMALSPIEVCVLRT